MQPNACLQMTRSGVSRRTIRRHPMGRACSATSRSMWAAAGRTAVEFAVRVADRGQQPRLGIANALANHDSWVSAKGSPARVDRLLSRPVDSALAKYARAQKHLGEL